MKIYAIKDRLLNYFQQPFAGPGDNQVLAALSTHINNPEATNDVAQAPQHFEVWALGHVTEDGHLVPERNFIADCASLIRRSLRETETRTAAEALPAAGGRRGAANGAGGHEGAGNGSVPRQTPPEGPASEEVHRGSQGGYPPRGDS